MQILSKNKRQRFVVLLAATVSLVQPVLASANNSINGLGERESIIAGISAPDLKDDVLYRPRWSLPPNGALQKLPLNGETTDDDTSKAAEPKSATGQADAKVKQNPQKKPAITRSERLNLDQSAATSTTSESDAVVEPQINKIQKQASTDAPTPAKQPAPKVVPPITPAVAAPTQVVPTLTPPETPTQTPTMSAPIPGAFIINHTPSFITPSLSAESVDESRSLTTAADTRIQSRMLSPGGCSSIESSGLSLSILK